MFDRRPKKLRNWLLFAVMIPMIVYANNGSSPSPWTAEDIVNQESAKGFNLSPDGSMVVWAKSVYDKDKDKLITHLFLSPLEETAESLQLTRGDFSEVNPCWSPSGRSIAFLSDRRGGKEESEGMQVWLLDPKGGEPWKATSLEMGVVQFAWLSDDSLLLLAREPRTLREIKEKDKKDTSFIAEDQDHMTPQRLFCFEIKTKTLVSLTENNDRITDFELSHDKTKILTENQQSVRYEADKKIKPKYFLMDIVSKTTEEIFPDPAFKPSSMAWAMDDSFFYFSVIRTSDPANGGPGADFLYTCDLKSKTVKEVPLEWENGLFILDFVVREDGFITSLANGARPKWRRYVRTETGYSHRDLEGPHCSHLYRLVLPDKGKNAVYLYTTASLPMQWFLGTLEGNVLSSKRQITDLNPDLANKVKAKVEIVRWKGSLDDEVEGLLYYPYHYQQGRRYPLFVSIHGGPEDLDMDAFDENWTSYPNLLAQKECFVLLPNYHGSGGYGQKFAESIKGHYYEYEIPDILKGIDALVEKNLIDPERLGVMGWSNGGILTIGLSVWSDRFKVAGVGAADVNWTSDYGNCAFGVSFDNYYLKGAPWDHLDHYLQKSPLFYLKKMKVPTIIFHGTEDTSVPYEQGWEYYRALQQIGAAPVRFVVFPGEPHIFTQRTHRLRKMEEELAWFDKYFFQAATEVNEALKSGSPLDIALKMRTFARSGTKFGRLVKGKLVPELIASGNLEVGRFEVTRAQWAAFDPRPAVGAGLENYPAAGMSFAEAQAYVRWLKKLTGEDVRLPTLEEAEALAKNAGPNENTIDYWAGYAPNVDDRALLSRKIKELPGRAPLLSPVDRFGAVGEEMIFGLGGNAAEWTEGPGGQGKAFGPSAVTRFASSEAEASPPAEYVGLRVVKSR